MSLWLLCPGPLIEATSPRLAQLASTALDIRKARDASAIVSHSCATSPQRGAFLSAASYNSLNRRSTLNGLLSLRVESDGALSGSCIELAMAGSDGFAAANDGGDVLCSGVCGVGQCCCVMVRVGRMVSTSFCMTTDCTPDLTECEADMVPRVGK